MDESTPQQPGLSNIAGEIGRLTVEYDRANVRRIASALDCGDRLLDAKAACAHGQWEPWLAGNFAKGERTARRWMRLAAARAAGLLKTATVSDLGGIRAAEGMLADLNRHDPDGQWHYPGILVGLDEDEGPVDRTDAMLARLYLRRLGVWLTSTAGDHSDPLMARAFDLACEHYGGLTDPVTKGYVGDYTAAKWIAAGVGLATK